MAETDLIAAVRAGDTEAVEALLRAGADPNEQDDLGWTALCFAAGNGKDGIVKCLLDYGADVFRTGDDRRTPYLVALAAQHIRIARMLYIAEEQAGADVERRSSRQSEYRPYCRAYQLDVLRHFSGWPERAKLAASATQPDAAGNSGAAATNADVVFIHRDFTVTLSIWIGEDVVFDAVTSDWKLFCKTILRFRPPGDFDLAADQG